MKRKLCLFVICSVVVASAFLIGCDGAKSKLGHVWPPVVGAPYPDLELFDSAGNAVSLSKFKGKVILIEPIGMNCPACQAFAGAHEAGKFQGVTPQQNLLSIEKMFPDYSGGLSLSDSRIVYIQLLLYNMKMQAPTTQDLKAWENHFRVKRYPNRYAFHGRAELVGNASFEMIPGFQLVDKNFILRADAAGHAPRDNLYAALLPKVSALVNEKS